VEKIMNLSKYTKKELLLSAIKSEIESHRIYTLLAEKIENGLMKDKFIFLAREEQKHKNFLESIFKNEFTKENLVLPEKTPIPLPKVTIPDNENISISTILAQSIEAEKAAADFYRSLSEQFTDKDIKHMLHYFSDMEIGHMRLLEQEKDSMEWFEQADVYWPMIHAGP
jgi:rubrerythrin